MRAVPYTLGPERHALPQRTPADEGTIVTTITLTRGLPGSGKSTFARQFVAESPDTRVRVNRDDIRHMLFGKYWGVDENTVTRAEEALVKSALTAGKDVIVDATHLRAQFVKRWHKVGPVKIIDFRLP